MHFLLRHRESWLTVLSVEILASNSSHKLNYERWLIDVEYATETTAHVPVYLCPALC